MKAKSTEQSLAKRVVIGGSIVTIFSLLAAPLGYATRMINSRWLSTAEFGLFYSVISLLWF